MRAPRLTEQQRRHRPLVVLLGPTAVGKSAAGIRIAQRYETEVLTADSRQVYRGMDIGTDKPSIEERQGVPHRLIDLADPDEPFNAGRYRRGWIGFGPWRDLNIWRDQGRHGDRDKIDADPVKCDFSAAGGRENRSTKILSKAFYK